MRLLFAVCFLGSWLATISNAMSSTLSISENSTFKATPDTKINETSSTSGKSPEAPSSPATISTPTVMTSTASETAKIHTTVEITSSTTPKVTSSTVTQLPSTTTVTTKDVTTTVQPTSTTLSTSSKQVSSNHLTPPFPTTLPPPSTTEPEDKNITRITEPETAPTQTAPGAPHQVTSESRPSVETILSTSLNSNSSNITATGAITSGLQTSPTTLQTTSTETTSRNETAVKEPEQDQPRGTQESAKTESTTRPPWSPAITPEPRMQSEVKCMAESKHQTISLTLTDYTNCKHFIQNKKEKLSHLLCNKLIEREDLKFLTYCEIKLSPDMTDSKKLNIDILFRVDERKISKLLNDEEKSLKELGLQFTSAQKGEFDDSQSATELKKLIAMVVTGSLLLLVFLSAIIYRCAQRKSQHKKDLCLNEEMHVVDNGCHDNPAMDIIESEPEMQEKANSKTSCQENMDGWIVPIDSLTKNEPEEEDTHL